MSRPRTLAGTLTVLTALVLAGCGDDDPDRASKPDETPSSSSSASTPATPSEAPYQVIKGPLSRCGPLPAAAAEAGFDHQVLSDPKVGRIPAITAGSGRTVVVLLHQTDGNGLCGWVEFAATLAADPRLSVMAIDLCRYGEAVCTKAENDTFDVADQTDPVELALRHAQGPMSAKRIVVMGASMGGSLALMAAAKLPGIDKAVDLSGPVDWDGMDAIRTGKELPVPVLVSMAEEEGPDQVDGSKRIVDNAPDGSEFVPVEAGHGYELLYETDGSLTPVAEQVLTWLAAG
jgi:pimeloyl-ACP methyl ester carboxylesterase